ncbi:MAG: TetR family transcriptional regulator C-terminal domain-containing protein [Rhodobacteraceae bacterium]|nr:TetR family transcriptional regulator C-terminal domain-containing protein [Paracoccaceae bacterium]
MAAMTANSPTDAPQPRKLSRETRRQQLIEATIETLARRGYARTTLTDVARLAGLSHGLVNFHFETKEKLLSETLLYLAEEYKQNWKSALEAAGSTAAEQLDALLRADFKPEICTESRLSAWCAFWGEAQCRPMYQEQCGSNDAAYNALLASICARMNKESGASFHPERVARVLRVTVEGVWLDLMTMSTPYARDEAMRTVYTSASAFYPKHFTEAGLIAKG